MKVFTKKGITQKIILAVILVTLCNFIFPMYSRADIGGILFNPIVELVTSVGDSILAILQSYLYNGKLNIKAGLGSIFMGAGYFKTVQNDGYKDFEEMRFSDPNGVAVEIDSDEFDKIDVLSIATLIISPTAGAVAIIADALIDNNWLVPTVQYSVDKIFSGKIPAFDINFINPNQYNGDANKQGASIAIAITKTIGKWYVALRNLAIVILLSVLVYSGIRIVISSSADDRAKYKERAIDWLIAMCLIFFMHYIMAFILQMIDVLNETIGQDISSIPVKISNGIQYNTDLMGLVRLQVQYKDFTPKVIYLILYIALLVYTCKYTWVYLKRTVTMAFLTIIAPLVAMTYPIDKISDGKAQAFNAWLKEYIFTALLQPFHLIIYTVLVGSAIDLAVKNPLYAIMVIAFMGPAEKMLRKFFGFDKASTPGMLSQAGAMFGGAAAWNAIKKGVGVVAGKASQGGKPSGGNNNVRTATSYENKNSPSPYEGFDKPQEQRQVEGGRDESSNERRKVNVEKTTEDTYDSNTQHSFTSGDDNSITSDNYPQDDGNWDNNDMYLNPDKYWNDTQDEKDKPQELENKDKPQESENGEQNSEQIRTKDENSTEQEEQQSTETESRNSNLEGQEEKANKNRLLNAIRRNMFLTPVGRGVKKQIKNTVDSKFANGNWKRTLKNGGVKAAKLAGRLAVAGTMGAIGVGVGIAGDDLDDVLKFGGAGAVLGYTTAPAVGKKVTNSKLGKSISSEVGKAYYGSDNAASVAKLENELRTSGELRDWSQETFLDDDGNKREGKELNELEDRAIGHYVDGFTDKGEIKKVMKLEDKMRKELAGNLPKSERNQEKVINEINEKARIMSETAGKMAKDVDPKKLSDPKYVSQQLERFKKGIKGANKDLSDAEVTNNATQMMNYIMSYYKQP